jgi:hypothetical protein
VKTGADNANFSGLIGKLIVWDRGGLHLRRYRKQRLISIFSAISSYRPTESHSYNLPAEAHTAADPAKSNIEEATIGDRLVRTYRMARLSDMKCLARPLD